jgi:TusA-related sulfurtransferase
MTDIPNVNQTLDAKGLLCPMPIVRLAKAVRELQSGQVVLLEATDPGAKADVNAWSRSTGHAILAQETGEPVMRFWIQKA